MPGFIYFADRHNGVVTPENIAAWGLSYAFPDGCAITSVECNFSTPTQGPGVAFGTPERLKPKDCKIEEGQTWRCMPTVEGRPKLWVGYWRDAKPTPESLARRTPVELPGLPILLDDGNWWIVPNVRRYDSPQQWRSELPAHWDYNEQGEIVNGKPATKYQHLWALTEPIARGFEAELSGEPNEAPQATFDSVAMALLQANYLVDVPEIVQLQAVLAGEVPKMICKFACQYHELVDWLEASQKKSDPADSLGLITADGETD